MSNLHFSKNNKLSRFIMGKGFYLVLALCLVGAGAAAWIAADRTLSNVGEQNQGIIDNSSPQEGYAWDISNQPTENNQKDVPKDSSSSSQSSSSQSSQSSSSEPAVPSEQPVIVPKQQTYVFVLPINGEVITKFSGGKLVKNDTTKVWRTHDGIDIKADVGANVLAVQGGTVLAVRDDVLWGTVVEIEHTNGLVSYYCGLGKQVKVKKGDIVKMEQIIGAVEGVPCEKTAPGHLHFGMKKDGQWVDPLVAMGKI